MVSQRPLLPAIVTYASAQWGSEDEFEDSVTVVAAFFDGSDIIYSVMWSKPRDGSWDNEGITEEVVGQTNLDCSADALNLDAEMTGKRIRVYWPKDKTWYKGTIKCYESYPEADASPVEGHHHIVYDDDEEEWLNLLQPHKDLPAWEVEPFTEDRFAF